jgi:hypothetical protein
MPTPVRTREIFRHLFRQRRDERALDFPGAHLILPYKNVDLSPTVRTRSSGPKPRRPDDLLDAWEERDFSNSPCVAARRRNLHARS